MKLIGKLVMVKFPDQEPPVRLEGRVVEERDRLVEVSLEPLEPRHDLSALFRNYPRVELELVDGGQVFGLGCDLDSYSCNYPRTILLQPKGSSHTIQRRRYPRLDVHLSAKLAATEANSPASSRLWSDGEVINLSLGGAALRTRQPLFFGEQYVVQFTAARLVTPRVRVVRVSPVGDDFINGLQFLQLTPAEHSSLQVYLAAMGGPGAVQENY